MRILRLPESGVEVQRETHPPPSPFRMLIGTRWLRNLSSSGRAPEKQLKGVVVSLVTRGASEDRVPIRQP